MLMIADGSNAPTSENYNAVYRSEKNRILLLTPFQVRDGCLGAIQGQLKCPYIKGSSETIARILQAHGIRVAHKPITTLRQLLTNVKDKVEPKDRQGAVYKIKCCDCPASYAGETGRNLNTRLTEHRRATKNGDSKNNIAGHHLQTDHRIDWDSAECISFSTDYYQRLTPESCFTN